MTGWLHLLPEFTLAGTAGAVLLADLVFGAGVRRGLVPLALVGTAGTLAVLLAATPAGSFDGAFAADATAAYFKVLLLAALAAVLGLSRDIERLTGRPPAEYLFLLLCATLGMLFLASATELVLLYVGLELATFPLVLLTAYQPRRARSAEGGIKYLLLAALGSAVLLFGLSWLYALTGATRLDMLTAVLAAGRVPFPPLAVGLACVMGGVGFKLALVPFHTWAPDAYEGAPTPVTAFLSVAGKTAGFALAVRLLAGFLPAAAPWWTVLLGGLAAVTMVLGNLAAMPQRNLKRLLAYSSIAQAGYLVMGLVAFGEQALAAMLYYLAAYLVTNLAAFAVVTAVERATGSADVSAFQGLARRAPRLALVLMLALLSLAGIPPLAGFTAKFVLFTAAYGQGLVGLVFLAVLNSALSLYYYLRIIKAAYITPPPEPAAGVPVPAVLAVVLVLCLAGILVLGVVPAPFMAWAQSAVPGGL